MRVSDGHEDKTTILCLCSKTIPGVFADISLWVLPKHHVWVYFGKVSTTLVRVSQTPKMKPSNKIFWGREVCEPLKQNIPEGLQTSKIRPLKQTLRGVLQNPKSKTPLKMRLPPIWIYIHKAYAAHLRCYSVVTIDVNVLQTFTCISKQM